jgi:hypothetical protein
MATAKTKSIIGTEFEKYEKKYDTKDMFWGYYNPKGIRIITCKTEKGLATQWRLYLKDWDIEM